MEGKDAFQVEVDGRSEREAPGTLYEAEQHEASMESWRREASGEREATGPSAGWGTTTAGGRTVEARKRRMTGSRSSRSR